MSRIKVVDCTLGTSGKCIENHFGEDNLLKIQKMINKLPINVLEYGILEGFSKGPDYSVYCTTSLPGAIRKKEGCLYSLMLDRVCQPEITSIQEWSEVTADIIRVPIDDERLDYRLDYCIKLKKKGYKVSVVVDEPAQYSLEEKKNIYNKINSIEPWAVGLFDVSGVLALHDYEEELILADDLFDSVIRIEIFPKENQKLVTQIIRRVSELNIARELLVNASIGGYGEGDLGIGTREAISFADELELDNENVVILDYLEEVMDRLAEDNTRAELSRLYHLTGSNGCSYKYAKYYHQKNVPLDELVDLFHNMTPEIKMRYNKANANEEIYRYQREKLSLVIAVIAEKEPRRLGRTLDYLADELLIFGIDCIVFDPFSSKKTKEIVNNYKIEGYFNYEYIELQNDDNIKDTRLFIKSALEKCLNYEYIWIIREEIIPTISFFINNLIEMKESGVDYLVIDATFRNNNRRCNKIYENCSDFLFDNNSRLSVIGTSIISSKLIKEYFEEGYHDSNSQGFWLPFVPLKMLAEKKSKAGLILGDTFIYDKEMFVRRFLESNNLSIWTNDWYGAIYSLPKEYDKVKGSAIRIRIPDANPYRISSLLYLRKSGEFSLLDFFRMKNRLSIVSANSTYKFFLASICPRVFAKCFWKMAECLKRVNNEKILKIVDRIHKKYEQIVG